MGFVCSVFMIRCRLCVLPETTLKTIHNGPCVADSSVKCIVGNTWWVGVHLSHFLSLSPFEHQGPLLLSGSMNWTQATNESIFSLTFPAPRFWPSPTSEVVGVGSAGIYMTDGSSSWSLRTAEPLHMGNLMSRTELEGSECNHGSGCGRSGSSASKLGTYRTLSLNSCKKYSRSTFFFFF